MAEHLLFRVQIKLWTLLILLILLMGATTVFRSYPQKALSSLNNRAEIFSELRRAMGSLYGNNIPMSITAYEYTRTDGQATTYDKPAKFWVGFNTQKLTIPSKALLQGYQLKTRLLLLLLTVMLLPINSITQCLLPYMMLLLILIHRQSKW